VVNNLISTYPDDVAISDVSLILECLCDLVSNSKHEDVLIAAFHLLSMCLQTEPFKKAGIVITNAA